MHLDLHRAGFHDIEQLFRHGDEIFALGGIGVERRARHIERAFRREQAEIERIDRAGGLTEQRDDAERGEAIQRFQEGVLADGVVDHGALLAAGDLRDALHEVLAGVDDGVVATMGFREFCFLVAADGADHGGAEMLGPLAEDEADAAGRGVQQNGVAGFHAIGLADQILRGQAFQHHGRCSLVIDAVRHLEQTIRRDHPRLGIGAHRRIAIGDAVAGLEVSDARADILDHAGALAAEPTRQLHRVETGAIVDIDEVEADGGVADARLARARLADLDLLPDQNIGGTGFVKADGVRHGYSPSNEMMIGIRVAVLRLDNDVAVFDMDRKGLGHVGSLLQLLAALDRDGIGAYFHAVRIEPGLTGAHVELPAVPGASQELADAVADIDAGLGRGQARDTGGFRQRCALMRAAIEQREELAIDMEDHDVAALHADNLVAAGRDIGCTRDNVTGHVVILRMILSKNRCPIFRIMR